MFPNPEDLFREIPGIRPRRELWNLDANTLLENVYNELETKNPAKFYDLSEWNMWQSADQERFMVSKSAKSTILCDILNEKTVAVPMEISDHDVIFVEEDVMSPMELEDAVLDEIDVDAGLNLVLGDDPYRQFYDFDNWPPTPPSASEIDDLLSRIIEVGEEFDLKVALRSFRKRKMPNTLRSTSPVFLSQSQLLEKRETSTPLGDSKGT